MSLEGLKPVVFVHTTDMARAKTFYTEVLGLPLSGEDPYAVTVDLAGTPLRISLVEGWNAHPHTVIGWATPDITASVAALMAKGVTMMVYPGFGQDAHGIWTAPDGAARIAWFNDPDGNNLSLTQWG